MSGSLFGRGFLSPAVYLKGRFGIGQFSNDFSVLEIKAIGSPAHFLFSPVPLIKMKAISAAGGWSAFGASTSIRVSSSENRKSP
jgi:hypothetical protein